jgi:NADH-quinone oxidoreductase subunit M
MDFPLLTFLLLLPTLGALFLQVISSKAKTSIRMASFWFSLMTFLGSLALPALYKGQEAGLQLADRLDWIPSLGISYSVAVDGISLWLVVLTTFTTPIVILASWRSIDSRVKGFHTAMLLLETAIIGAFIAQDLILFYLFWEAMLVPMALLIGIWGAGRRVYSALKFFLFTAGGSLPMLIAILYLWWQVGQATDGGYSFNLEYLADHMGAIGAEAKITCFWAFALAFAVKVPMWPLHTWLPDAHSDAPTGGSIILAGVLLKMGIYGFLRFSFALFPQLVAQYSHTGIFHVLAVIGIIYGACMAIVQTDVKRLVAYSSVSHLGFCVLGLFSLTAHGVCGSIYQMLAHGVSTGGLFLLVGIIYERRHTREISEFGGLVNVMPKYAFAFMVITLASVGLPTTVGFIGEFLILMGTFTGSSQGAMFYAILAATGVVLGAVYMFRLYQRMFWGEVTNEANRNLPDLSGREKMCLWALLILVFVMGLLPGLFLGQIEPSVQDTLQNVVTWLPMEGR